MDSYGKELILDLEACDPSLFNRNDLTIFFEELCYRIQMEAVQSHFWGNEGLSEEEMRTQPHLVGISAIQFIKTSNITIHALDILKCVYLNIFSCKDFDEVTAAAFCTVFFKGSIQHMTLLPRL